MTDVRIEEGKEGRSVEEGRLRLKRRFAFKNVRGASLIFSFISLIPDEQAYFALKEA